MCFAIWLAFDAAQLFSNAANGSPLGTRRSVAMSILRPIAYVERHLGVDRVVANADRAIGKSPPAGAGGSVIAATPPPPRHREKPPAKHHGGTSGPVATTTTLPTNVVAQPTARHPMTVLDIGDSIGEDLGIGLGDVLGSHKDVKVIQDAVGNTGLADPGYFNWPKTLSGELARYHPAIVVVMLGGNDWQPFLTGPNTAATPGTAYWQKFYGARVAQLIDEAQATGAKVFWVGLPPMGPASQLPAAMAPGLNAVFAAEAKATGATYVPTWSAFANSAGQFAEYLPNAAGQLVAVRDPDGVHLAPPAGCDLAATIVVKAIDQRLHIAL